MVTTRRIGPGLIMERLWKETGCERVVRDLLAGRNFGFPAERAIFLTVVHRLFHTGAEKRSDRAADKGQDEVQLTGVETLQLHQLYRAMAWLGEELPEEDQAGRTAFSSAASC